MPGLLRLVRVLVHEESSSKVLFVLMVGDERVSLVVESKDSIKALGL